MSAAAEPLDPRPVRTLRPVPALDASARRPQDSLDAFLTALRDLPLLPPDRIAGLAREIRAGEKRFREQIRCVPGTAVLLLERWRERKANGRVTGILYHHYRDRPDEAWSRFIDEKLEAVEDLLTERHSHLRDASRRRRLESRLAEVVDSAEILFEVLRDIALELRAATEGERADARARLRELGLDAPAAQRALQRAEQALRQRDEARRTMASHNLRLVVHVAKRYRGPGVAFADLVQDGCIGLMRAVDKFDPDLGYRFSTYAVWWIEQAVIRAIQSSSRTVRIPSHVYDLQLRLRDAEKKLGLRDGDPDPSELASELGIPLEQLDLVVASQRPVHSLERAGDEDEGPSIGERLCDPQAVDPSQQIDRSKLREVLTGGLMALRPRERAVLSWRFGLEEGGAHSLQEIGEKLGLSRERVRQIQNGALEKLSRQQPVAALRGLVSEPPDVWATGRTE